jgi:hypothetical protein
MEEKIRKLTYKMALGHYNDVSIWFDRRSEQRKIRK